MATRPETVAHLSDLLGAAFTFRKMFGEYAMYLDGKVVALICDDQLFAKPTASARALLPDAELAPPYPGAKPHLLLTEDLDDPDLVTQALRAIAADLPAPKPKRPKGK